jgi:hypothetical protein
MKAKIISTGEIIKIADYARVTLDKCDDYGNPIEVPFNDVELLKEPLNTIDWHQVRIQAAIAAMQGICTNDEAFVNMSNGLIVRNSVGLADALVKELKGE